MPVFQRRVFGPALTPVRTFATTQATRVLRGFAPVPMPCDFGDLSPINSFVPPPIKAVAVFFGVRMPLNPSTRNAVFLIFNAAMNDPSRRDVILQSLATALDDFGAHESAACVRSHVTY